ncbi:MAG: hypothetical protein JXR91_13780, partial [Deltaproteobacteria bacterium]|nr:hypothetical protein [Deltaproteobacteria bacterium]
MLIFIFLSVFNFCFIALGGCGTAPYAPQPTKQVRVSVARGTCLYLLSTLHGEDISTEKLI